MSIKDSLISKNGKFITHTLPTFYPLSHTLPTFSPSLSYVTNFSLKPVLSTYEYFLWTSMWKLSNYIGQYDIPSMRFSTCYANLWEDLYSCGFSTFNCLRVMNFTLYLLLLGRIPSFHIVVFWEASTLYEMIFHSIYIKC